MRDTYRPLASPATYASALQALAERGIAAVRKRMLLAHYSMPDHVATMRHLAASVGRPSEHGFANLHYGGLAGQIHRELGLRHRGVRLWTLATWPEDPIDGLGEFAFRMRPELVRALERLGWVARRIKVPTATRAPARDIEGERVPQLRQHRQRERGLRDAKIADASARSPDGRLRCEVPGCGFDFEIAYGKLGRGYIQVHHLKPLSQRSRPRRTSLDELMLVCANCHAIIHRGGKNRSPGTLRL